MRPMSPMPPSKQTRPRAGSDASVTTTTTQKRPRESDLLSPRKYEDDPSPRPASFKKRKNVSAADHESDYAETDGATKRRRVDDRRDIEPKQDRGKGREGDIQSYRIAKRPRSRSPPRVRKKLSPMPPRVKKEPSPMPPPLRSPLPSGGRNGTPLPSRAKERQPSDASSRSRPEQDRRESGSSRSRRQSITYTSSEDEGPKRRSFKPLRPLPEDARDLRRYYNRMYTIYGEMFLEHRRLTLKAKDLLDDDDDRMSDSDDLDVAPRAIDAFMREYDRVCDELQKIAEAYERITGARPA